MIIIELSSDKYALIDDIDKEICKMKWYYSSGYALHRNGSYKNYKNTFIMHRLIMENMINRPLLKKELVDHINHDTLDNRRGNLRIVTVLENNRNRRATFSRKPYHGLKPK